MGSFRFRRALGLGATLAFGLGVTAAVATIAGATQASHQDDRQGGGATLLASEIAAMKAAGLAADDPKVRMLRDDLDTLQRGRDAAAPQEPGVHAGATLGGQGRPSTRDAGDAEATPWDDGAVQCEVIPPDLLTAQDIAGATCTSTLDPDGGSHYRAVTPDGVAHTVHFAPDGTVTRTPDTPG